MASPPLDPDSGPNRTTSCRGPVQTSAVYLLGSAPFPADPPPSPPSPLTPDTGGLCNPIEDLSLDSPPTSPIAEPIPLLTSPAHTSRLSTAVHVLSTEALALSSLAHLYTTSPTARDAFSTAVAILTTTFSPASTSGGSSKLILSGVGKSGLIARKLAATFSSLSLPSSFLHPVEALHGDVGLVRPGDAVLLISYSGCTPELLSLLPHLDPSLAVVLLTGARPESAEIARRRPGCVVLPAPVHEEERVSFGVRAPMTSTTAAVAVGDALALGVAREVWAGGVGGVFEGNHPGGAIGETGRRQRAGREVRELAVGWEEIPWVCGEERGEVVLAGDVLRTGFGSPSGWVRVGDGVVSPRRMTGLKTRDLGRKVDEVKGLVVSWREFVSVAAETRLCAAADWVREMHDVGEDKDGPEIMAILEHGELVGVLEVSLLLQQSIGEAR